ncbi:MAG: TRAM domain-containing protein, partial [Pontiella sp.]|nr:TRAM domain-containing protein [Pontiella sp.]
MYKKKQIVEVEIIDLGDKNQCFGRLEDGMSIFVQGAAAVGDVVRAEIFKIKKNYLVSRFRKLVKPSPHRIEPVCPYFGLCGGCKWQHMDYAEQLRLKQKQVQDALEHLGGFKETVCEPCVPAPALFGYRNKMDFSFTDLRYLTPDEMEIEAGDHAKPLDFALGFHAPGCYSKAID